MDNFTPEQFTTILTIIAGAVTAFGTIAGLIARNWTQKQDKKLDEAQAQADLAAAEAAKAKTDADSLNKLIDVLSMSQTSRDRKDDAFLMELKSIGGGLADLHTIDTQRIKQNDVTAAQVTGAREDIRTLGVAFEAGKNDAVTKVNQAMDDKLKPIEDRLRNIQQQVADTLALLRGMEARPFVPAVTLVAKADEPKADEPKEDEAEDKSA